MTMNETVHSTDHATNNNEGRQHENTVMGNAFKELAQKLTNKKEEITTSNISEVLKNRGVIGESKTADVVSFPFERTEEAQQELGREVGVEVKKIIEEYAWNKGGISPIGDTISHMTTEKPGSMENSPISYRPPEKASEEAPPIAYRSPDGIVVPTREHPDEKQNADAPSQEAPIANEELGRSFLYDETIVRINKEVEEIRRKAKEATAQLRDHTKDASEPQKMLRQADERMSELNKERTEHIKNKIRNASIEEVRAIKEAAHKVLMNPAEKYKTEAVDALQAADDRIKELELAGKMGEASEAATPRAETTQKTAPEKQSPQEELVRRIGVEEANLINDARDRALIERMCRERGIEVSPSDTRDDIFKKLKARWDAGLLGEQKRETETELEKLSREDKTPETRARMEELEKNLAALDSVEISSEERKVRDAVAPVSSQHETIIPENQEGIAAPKEEVLNPFEKAITKIRSEDPKRAERLLAAIGASPEQKERIEKLLGATQTFTEKTEAIEKEKNSWVVERALKIGDWYRRLPLKYKLAAATVFMSSASVVGALGGAGIGMIMGAVFVGSTGQRFLGSLAMFVTVEGMLTKRSLARNEEEKKIMGVRMNVILGALAGSGVFLGGKLLGDYLSSGGEHVAEVTPPPSPQVPVVPAPETLDLNAKEVFDSVQEKIKAAIPLPHEEMAAANNSIMTPGNELIGHAAAAESTSSIMTPGNELFGHAADKMIETSYAVHGGDNLWNIIKEKIPEIQGLDGEGRQSNAIANIIEQIKKDPESFGITSGNVDTLSAGDTIDLEKVREVLDTTKISVGGHETSIIERAIGLTDIEASHIMENNAKISAWHTAHPDTLLTTETVDKILSGTIDSAAETNTLSEITKDYILNMPDTGGRTIEQLSAEALSLDTDAVLHAYVQTMFGSMGTNGERSVDWLDFKGRAVSEVVSKKFDALPVGEEGAVQKFGIDSPSAVDKLKGYLKLLVDKSGMNPNPGESVEHFSKRTISAIISKK